MAILSSEELAQQAEAVYVQGTYHVALLYNESGYDATIDYTDVLADEVTVGTGGYARLSYSYTSGDLEPYSNGQPLEEKTANFIHDGSSEDIIFTHVALIRQVASQYTVVAVEPAGEVAILTNGNTASININILHGKP